jgi:hypothetical protein
MNVKSKLAVQKKTIQPNQLLILDTPEEVERSVQEADETKKQLANTKITEILTELQHLPYIKKTRDKIIVIHKKDNPKAPSRRKI